MTQREKDIFISLSKGLNDSISDIISKLKTSNINFKTELQDSEKPITDRKLFWSELWKTEDVIH